MAQASEATRAAQAHLLPVLQQAADWQVGHARQALDSTVVLECRESGKPLGIGCFFRIKLGCMSCAVVTAASVLPSREAVHKTNARFFAFPHASRRNAAAILDFDSDVAVEGLVLRLDPLSFFTNGHYSVVQVKDPQEEEEQEEEQSTHGLNSVQQQSAAEMSSASAAEEGFSRADALRGSLLNRFSLLASLGVCMSHADLGISQHYPSLAVFVQPPANGEKESSWPVGRGASVVPGRAFPDYSNRLGWRADRAVTGLPGTPLFMQEAAMHRIDDTEDRSTRLNYVPDYPELFEDTWEPIFKLWGILLPSPNDAGSSSKQTNFDILPLRDVVSDLLFNRHFLKYFPPLVPPKPKEEIESSSTSDRSTSSETSESPGDLDSDDSYSLPEVRLDLLEDGSDAKRLLMAQQAVAQQMGEEVARQHHRSDRYLDTSDDDDDDDYDDDDDEGDEEDDDDDDEADDEDSDDDDSSS